MKCVNLYPEKGRPDGPPTLVHIERPGYRLLAAPPQAGVGRGVFRTSRGEGYCVVGQNVYSINPLTWAMTKIGSLSVPLTNLCSLTDNGTTGFLVDASTKGYSFNILDGSSYATIVDATGTFTGSLKVDYLDTYMLWAEQNSILFGSTESNQLTFNATFVAGKTGYPDLLQTLYVNWHQLLLFGEVRSEIWYDAGNPLFPFALLPGAYIEWGVVAPRSVAGINNDVYWLGQGFGGTGLVLRQRGYETRVVSNHAISYAITQMLKAGIDITDAVGNCYTQEGHVFYVLTFQAGDQTWVFDESIDSPDEAWHQRGFSDSNGILHRERAISYAYLANTNVVQDWQNGALYALDLDHYFDTCDDGDGQGVFDRPITRTRTFSQLKGIGFPIPQPIDYRRVRLKAFFAELECGNSPDGVNDTPPSITLRVSFDRGRSYDNGILQSAGHPGEYRTLPAWSPLGVGRWPVLELSWSYPGKTSLGGGWVDGEILLS
jgi:hypothetical protein